MVSAVKRHGLLQSYPWDFKFVRDSALSSKMNCTFGPGISHWLTAGQNVPPNKNKAPGHHNSNKPQGVNYETNTNTKHQYQNTNRVVAGSSGPAFRRRIDAEGRNSRVAAGPSPGDMSAYSGGTTSSTAIPVQCNYAARPVGGFGHQ